MVKVYVLYHAACTDGTGAKYAAWKKFGDTATYYPVQYGKPVPEMEPGSRVFIVDFSYDRDVLDGLRSIHRELVVLDHHKTAEEALRGCEGCHFDMNKSGAVLAWEYFHPGVPVPALLQHVQDRDLWKFEIKGTEEVHAGLGTYKGDMKSWDACVSNEFNMNRLVATGEVLLAKQKITVDNAVKSHVKVINFLGYKVGITNQTDLASEIGNAIYDSKVLDVQFAIVYCITTTNEVLFSLRSKGDMDVAEIAKKFGGGGHKNASGCRVTLETLTKILKGNM
jgi:oligoribonuclease NrnB/cAMP/cGMP phosphodiesterase (DHH superfamily)